MDSPSSCQLQSIQDSHQPLLFPYLESLRLKWLEEMSHVWKCNWNQMLILPFQNLTHISLDYCPKIRYLFSPLMAKYLSNLKKVFIASCRIFEEVVSSKDDEDEEYTTSPSSHHNTTLFPHLEILWVDSLPCLKSVDGGDQKWSRSVGTISSDAIHGQSQSGQVIGACWSLCQYPTEIHTYHCDALSSLVPWYSVGQMKRLQQLRISYCEKMKEIFESEPSPNNVDDEGSAPGTTLTSPTLQNITTLVVPQLSNLKSVEIFECPHLSHVFIFSTLESLKQLKDLKVERCNSMQVIVKEENIKTSSKLLVFPRLKSLIFKHLPDLKGFFMGVNDFKWLSLDHVMIDDCPQLMMFTFGESKTPNLKYMQTKLGKYSVACGDLNLHRMITKNSFPTCSSSDPTISKGVTWSFCNLVELNISHEKNLGRSIIPSNVLLQLEKLEKIDIFNFSGVNEVFEVVVALEGSGFHKSQTTVITIPNLTQVNLDSVRDLRYLWKSNPSMVLEFPNLTKVYVNGCHEMEHVFTCSMVGSLVQLQDLEIRFGWKMEVIVKDDKQEKECDVKVNLPRLKSLKLEYLPKLKGFCLGKHAFSLTTLDTLEIKGCKAIEVFTKGDLSAPNLKIIHTYSGMHAVTRDLNSFIKTI